jgi:hypothetical protein
MQGAGAAMPVLLGPKRHVCLQRMNKFFLPNIGKKQVGEYGQVQPHLVLQKDAELLASKTVNK